MGFIKTFKAKVGIAFLAAAVSFNAAAASILADADKSAITAGFANLSDTVKDVISVSWAPMLAIIALLAAPSIVKKIISIAKS